MKQGTQTTLISDLDEKYAESGDPAIEKLISRADRGDYHDLKSELPAPKMMLFRDLDLIGLDELAQKVMIGEYDEL